MSQYFLYIMSNKNRTVLYTGVTNDLVRRINEHKSATGSKFTADYKCDALVYYEEYKYVLDAIAREKQLKNWKREWKNELIAEFNPSLLDLAADF